MPPTIALASDTPIACYVHVPALLALPLLLASCVSLHKISSSNIAGPASGTVSNADRKLDTASLAQWWSRLNDPALNELIGTAFERSPDVRTALSRIDEARARRGLERAGLFPTLDANGSAQWQASGNGDSSPITTSDGGESYRVSVDASWQVDLFGKQKQTLIAASADLAQVQEDYQGAVVSLAAEVSQTYVTLRRAQAELTLKENTLETRGETLKITRWKEEAGVSTGLDTLQVESTLEQERAAIPFLKQTISQTQNELALLCGLTPGALNSRLNSGSSIPVAPPRLAIGIPAEMLQQRPDVRAALRGVEAAAARTKAAELERLPSLNLSGSIGSDALKAGKLFSPETVAASLLGGLTAPIFDAGRIRQNIAIQDAQTRQALIRYESTVLTSLSEVENALVAILRTAERLEVLDRAIHAARQAAQLAMQQYQAGQVDLLQVLESQRTLFSVQEQKVSTTADQTNAHIQLYKALGGGWSNN
jgi:multidrug efflux system outer membrane protein